jgi:hypothetical protein
MASRNWLSRASVKVSSVSGSPLRVAKPRSSRQVAAEEGAHQCEISLALPRRHGLGAPEIEEHDLVAIGDQEISRMRICLEDTRLEHLAHVGLQDETQDAGEAPSRVDVTPVSIRRELVEDRGDLPPLDESAGQHSSAAQRGEGPGNDDAGDLVEEIGQLLHHPGLGLVVHLPLDHRPHLGGDGPVVRGWEHGPDPRQGGLEQIHVHRDQRRDPRPLDLHRRRPPVEGDHLVDLADARGSDGLLVEAAEELLQRPSQLRLDHLADLLEADRRSGILQPGELGDPDLRKQVRPGREDLGNLEEGATLEDAELVEAPGVARVEGGQRLRGALAREEGGPGAVEAVARRDRTHPARPRRARRGSSSSSDIHRSTAWSATLRIPQTASSIPLTTSSTWSIQDSNRASPCIRMPSGGAWMSSVVIHCSTRSPGVPQ